MLKKISIIDTTVSLGNNQEVQITGDGDNVTFNLHNIVNNDDGFVDGFEMSWREIWDACKKLHHVGDR